MSFLRIATIRSSSSTLFRQTRAARRITSQPCLRSSGRRGYASATDAVHAVKKKSDLPWAATAVLVTGVGTYIALSPTDGAEHGHDTHHEGQGKHFGAEHADEAHEPEDHVKEDDAKATEEANEGTDAESEGKSDSEDSEKSEAKEDDKSGEEEKDEPKEDSKSSGEDKKGDDGKEQDDTNASEDQGTKDDTHKGMTKQQGDIKHREEDTGKGATKVRLDSPAGKPVGGENSPSSGEGDSQAKTQRGIANTDTKHSEDPHADSGKSSKGEGTADTAKIKGTVQPDRKQV